jgi:hypothetical protein
MFSDRNFVSVFISDVCYLSHHIFLDVIALIFGYEYKLWISSLCIFLHPPFTPPSWVHIFWAHRLHSSHCARDQVPHPHRTTDKLILIMFLNRKRVDKGFRNEWQRAFPESILNFFMNTVLICYCLSRYLNFVTFSKIIIAMCTLWLYPTFWWRDILVLPHFL